MKFLTGSQYFFKGYYDDYSRYDIDLVEIKDNTDKEWSHLRINSINNRGDLFVYKLQTIDGYIDLFNRNLNHPTMSCLFLTKNVVDYLGVTINDLLKIKNIIDRLHGKNEYWKIIYNSYIENNDFYLTDQQRDLAYQVYKESKNKRRK